MKILGIESSCDETAAAICEDGRKVLADVIYSQADMHATFGGVVPEIASRKHVEKIALVAEECLQKAGVKPSDIGAVCATCAPGLIGALLVGANFAKACAMAWGVPFVPVHHIKGHIAANYVAFPELEPPFVALVASGGHTLIAHVKSYTDMKVLGSTRDDAAGEAFDKIARVMGLPYPGGAKMDELSRQGDSSRYKLPKAVIEDNPLDMSFSGLKTAAVNMIHNASQKSEGIIIPDMAASVCRTVSDTIVPRVIRAAAEAGVDTVVAAGGVVANSTLRRDLTELCRKQGLRLFMPPLSLCGDNGAMIASQGYYEYISGSRAGMDQNCFATMSIEQKFCEF